MQSPSKRYITPHSDAPMWADWMRPNRGNNSSWDSALVASLTTDSDHASDDIEGASLDASVPMGSLWQLPPTPTLSSGRSSSQFSDESPSLSEPEELPEIPFVSEIPARSSNELGSYDFSSVGNTVDEREFWDNIIRPNLSRSSGKRAALLGQTNQRVLSAHRGRSSSASSSRASSRTRPAPAKSILSSSSSIKTCKGRSPPSVKFLDAPTIHYDSHRDDDFPFEASPPSDNKPREGQTSSILGFFRRIIGSPSKKPQVPEKPVISGPIPLCEGPRRRARHSLDETAGRMKRTPSLRSNKSSTSLRSIRSCSSRLQTYWERVSGKDP